MRFSARRICWLLCIGIVAGCHSAVEPAPKAVGAATATSSVAATAGSTAAPAARKPELANPKSTQSQVAAFKPQFPERTDMFEPPKRAQSTLRRDEEHGQSVELKGFINVGDQPRVILSIDGVVSAIPEGGEKYGVQVLSIQPPKVMLQRGRNRWPATLE